jgi:cyclopropane-fatty-acyl-phospholipid synthase
LPRLIRRWRRVSPAGVLLEPELKLGEAYMNGSLAIEQGSIADLLEMAMGAAYGHVLRRAHPLD